MAIGRDGTVYIASNAAQSIFRVTLDGNMGQIQSGVNVAVNCNLLLSDCLPTTANAIAGALAIEPAGGLLFTANNDVIRLASGFTPAQSVSEMFISSPDASEVYVFDLYGRHLRTLDALTTAVTRTFGYDAAGRLITITDHHLVRTVGVLLEDLPGDAFAGGDHELHPAGALRAVEHVNGGLPWSSAAEAGASRQDVELSNPLGPNLRLERPIASWVEATRQHALPAQDRGCFAYPFTP